MPHSGSVHPHHKIHHNAPFSRDVDLTSGNLFKKMGLYTLPIVLLSLLQLVYNSADQIIVSFFGDGYTSMTAVGSNNALINLLIGLFVGVSVGVNVVVAKAYGEKDKETAQKALESSMLLSVLFGIAIGIFGYFMAPYLLEAMNTPASVLPKATIYLQIYFAGLPFLLVFNFGSAVLRALGDSKRPLFALIACGALNVGLNFLFVIAFDLDVAGVALTTLISEVLEAILVVIFLASKRQTFIRFSLKGLRLYKKETIAILKHGIPAGLQSFVFSVANVFIQSSINSYSDASVTSDIAMAGNAASLQIEGYIFACLDAFSVATTAVIAQNFGAKKKENVRKAFYYGAIYSILAGLIVGGLCVLLRDVLIGLFISKESFTSNGVFDDVGYANAMGVASKRLMLIGLTYFLDGIMEICASYCRGTGHPKTPTIVIMVFVTFFRLVFVLGVWPYVPFFHTLPWLWSSWPISWVLAIAAFAFILPRFAKANSKAIDESLSEEKKLELPKNG